MIALHRRPATAKGTKKGTQMTPEELGQKLMTLNDVEEMMLDLCESMGVDPEDETAYQDLKLQVLRSALECEALEATT